MLHDVAREAPMTAEFRDDRVCFVCGEKNPIGLHLRLRTDAERGESTAEVSFRDDFQGWTGIVHGGFVATVLDEALIYAAGAKGHICVTGEMTVRYVKAARTGVPYTLRGRFLEDKGRIVLAESELLDAAGEQVAWASGKLFKVPGEPRRF
jgi:uncharacterized protein (TIGR00369 family)